MKVIYFSNIYIEDSAAQSIQTRNMANAFSSVLHEKFKLITVSKNAYDDLKALPELMNVEVLRAYSHLRNRTARAILIFLKYSRYFFLDRKTIVFTRELIPAILSLISGNKTVFEIHKEPTGHISGVILKLISRSKNLYVLSISNSLDLLIKNKYKVRNSLIYHDCVDESKYDSLVINKSEIREKLRLDRNHVYVVYTGSLYKGNDINLIKVLVENFSHIKFIVIGGKEEEISKLKGDINKDNIQFIGTLPQEIVREYQVAADILFYPLTMSNPLWKYTSPLKLFEYFAARNIVLASYIGAVKEIIKDDYCFTFNPNSDDSIINAMNNCLNSEDAHKEEMIKLAYSQVLTKYNWKARVRYILDATNPV